MAGSTLLLSPFDSPTDAGSDGRPVPAIRPPTGIGCAEPDEVVRQVPGRDAPEPDHPFSDSERIESDLLRVVRRLSVTRQRLEPQPHAPSADGRPGVGSLAASEHGTRRYTVRERLDEVGHADAGGDRDCADGGTPVVPCQCDPCLDISSGHSTHGFGAGLSGALSGVPEPDHSCRDVSRQKHRLAATQSREKSVPPAEGGVTMDIQPDRGPSDGLRSLHCEAELWPPIDPLQIMERRAGKRAERPLAAEAPIPLPVRESSPAVAARTGASWAAPRRNRGCCGKEVVGHARVCAPRRGTGMAERAWAASGLPLVKAWRPGVSPEPRVEWIGARTFRGSRW